MTNQNLENAVDEDFLRSNLEQLSTAASSHELLHRFKGVALTLGFGGCSVYAMPPSTAERLLPHIIFSSWPDSLIKRLDDSNLTVSLPAIAHLKRSTRPYIWHIDDEALVEATPSSSAVLEILQQYGITTDVYFSIQGPDGSRFLVSIAGGRARATPDEMGILHLVASYAVNRLYDITSEERLALPSLTTREHECLVWTAAGKTSAEIAMILNLSSHTVNHYLTGATRKLACVSRTQAVAKAFRLGLIE